MLHWRFFLRTLFIWSRVPSISVSLINSSPEFTQKIPTVDLPLSIPNLLGQNQTVPVVHAARAEPILRPEGLTSHILVPKRLDDGIADLVSLMVKPARAGIPMHQGALW